MWYYNNQKGIFKDPLNHTPHGNYVPTLAALYQAKQYTECIEATQALMNDRERFPGNPRDYFKGLYLIILAVCEPEGKHARVLNLQALHMFRAVVKNESRTFRSQALLETMILISIGVNIHLGGAENQRGERTQAMDYETKEWLRPRSIKDLGLDAFMVHYALVVEFGGMPDPEREDDSDDAMELELETEDQELCSEGGEGVREGMKDADIQPLVEEPHPAKDTVMSSSSSPETGPAIYLELPLEDTPDPEAAAEVQSSEHAVQANNLLSSPLRVRWKGQKRPSVGSHLEDYSPKRHRLGSGRRSTIPGSRSTRPPPHTNDSGKLLTMEYLKMGKRGQQEVSSDMHDEQDIDMEDGGLS